jgi:hypothetical protein
MRRSVVCIMTGHSKATFFAVGPRPHCKSWFGRCGDMTTRSSRLDVLHRHLWSDGNALHV